MNIYNSKSNKLYKLIYLLTLVYIIQTPDTLSAATTSNISNILFNTNKSTTSINPLNQGQKDLINEYVINIFCTETNKKQIKAASGSGIFLSNPDDVYGVVVTNAHVARHLLDKNKKCVGRTGSPTITTHTLNLRYIPSYWLNSNNQYIIGDFDQNTTGEYDFAIIETKKIKNIHKSKNLYDIFKPNLKIRLGNYDQSSQNIFIYSYPAQKILSKNINNPLFIKKDKVNLRAIYTSPKDIITESLLDISGSTNIDHGSSGGMVINQNTSNSLIGLSSVMIQEKPEQIIRIVTLKHIFNVLQKDLEMSKINNSDAFISNIKKALLSHEVDLSFAQILKDNNLIPILEQNTRNTLIKLEIIK